jgi:hypothetical protein
MILTYIRQRSITEETVGTLFRMALVFTLALFFADMVDAQTAGPQAARLIGTIQSEKFTGAVFSDSKGEQTFYRVFDTLPDGSQIVAVRSESISLKGTNGMSYDMYIAHDRIAGSTFSPPSADHYASESAPKQYEPTPAQQEFINRQKQRAKSDRAQRRKNEEGE